MSHSNPFVGRLILVVDDEPRMIKFVQFNLELDGFRVISAGNGLEAVEKVRTQLPDLVVLDVMMPEMDGFEALKQIREVSDVPVIMLTVGKPTKVVGTMSIFLEHYLSLHNHAGLVKMLKIKPY